MNDTLYARWLSGELTEQEIADLKASGEWGELQTLINEMDKLTLPKYDKDAAFQRLKNTQTKPHLKPESKVRKLNVRPLLAIAASVLLILTVGFLWRNNLNQNQFIVIETKAKETKTHTFEDQSSVTLNDGSQFAYQPQKWNESRLIKLTGEGFFEVEKGTPFKVVTQHGTVEVLGTSFNVRAWDERLYVECYTGKVRVIANEKSTTLTPTQSVSVIAGKMQTIQKIDHEKPLWSAAESRFYEENLGSVFQELERQFNVKINAPNNLPETFNGVFNHDSLEEALRQVCTPMGYFYDISGNEVFIKKKK